MSLARNLSEKDRSVSACFDWLYIFLKHWQRSRLAPPSRRRTGPPGRRIGARHVGRPVVVVLLVLLRHWLRAVQPPSLRPQGGRRPAGRRSQARVQHPRQMA